MRDDKNNIEKVKASPKANLIYIILMLIVAFACALVIMTQKDALEKQQTQRELYQNQIHEAKEEQARLNQLLQYMSSDEYKRAIAHEKLGLLSPNEIRFIESDR